MEVRTAGDRAIERDDDRVREWVGAVVDWGMTIARDGRFTFGILIQ